MSGADAYGTDGNQYAGHGLGLQQEDITQFLLQETGYFILSGSFHTVHFFYAGVQPVFTLAKLLKYIVLPTVYSFFFILFPIVGFILFRSVDEICLFVDSICCSCYASLTLMSVRRTADDE